MSGMGGLYDLQVNAPMASLFQPLVTQGGINQGYQTSSGTGGSQGLFGMLSGSLNSKGQWDVGIGG